MNDGKPRPGDTVKVEFEGRYAEDGTQMVVWVGGQGWIPVHGGKVTVIRREHELVPGQVWKRRADARVFCVLSSSVERAWLAPAEGYGSVAASEFDPTDFQLLFDPRWERVHSPLLPVGHIAYRTEATDVTPCPAVHPEDGLECEREAGHDEDHKYTIWKDKPYPSYPVVWRSSE